MMLAAHQPDLLPYPGFFAKMRRADVFDLAIYDQFQKKGYQRRVMMRDHWAQVLVRGKDSQQRICDVMLHPDAPDMLIRQIRDRYEKSRNWDQYGEMVIWWVDEARSELLWLFNLHLIVKIRDLLGITTPISIETAPLAPGIDGLVEMALRYGASVYLSGDGGHAYMGDAPDEAFRRAGVDLQWMNYTAPTGDSILTVLFDHDGPIREAF